MSVSLCKTNKISPIKVKEVVNVKNHFKVHFDVLVGPFRFIVV